MDNTKPIIKLDEISLEGEKFSFSSQTYLYFNEAFKDLVDSNAIEVEVYVTPMESGRSYHMNGWLKTQLPLMCSRCAVNFEKPLKLSIKEILMVGEEYELKGDKSVKSPHFSHSYNEDAPEVYFARTTDFDITEYLHEILALAIPLAPLGRDDCEKGTCPNLENAYKNGWLEKPSEDKKKSPFDVLKNFPINH